MFNKEKPQAETQPAGGEAADTSSPIGANRDVEQLQPAPDPFDVDSLRLPADADAAFGVRKLLVTVPVKKPEKTWFVRVHPDSAYRIQTALLDDDRETYFIARDVVPEISDEAAIRRCVLFTSITRQGVVFFWPIPLPGPDGRSNPWHESAFQAAALAEKQWVRVTANQSLGGYDVLTATGDIPEPQWPALTLSELLSIASRNRVIDRVDHPILQRLRGEV
jgi:hypothetical protein